MRRIHLANEAEDGCSYNPSSIEEVIEAHLRHSERQLRHSPKNGAGRPLTRGPLRVSEVELRAIRYEATRCFFSDAKLSEELRAQREEFREQHFERREGFKKNPQDTLNHLPRLLAVLFARACEAAVHGATGGFADMLAQAVIARRGRKDFSLTLRAEMWGECLRFAMGLADWEAAGAWVDRAWGYAPYENPIALSPGAELHEQKEVAQAFSAEFRKMFEEQMRHGSPAWLNEADRRIELRCLLSSAPRRGVKLDDPSKKAVALLLMVSPSLTTEQCCSKLDAKNETSPGNTPIPETWRKCGARSWSDAYGRFRVRVKTFVSTVRKEFGIAKSPSE